MQICPNCEHEVKNDARFCMSCGVAIENKPKTTIKEIKAEKGKMISTLTIIFGIMGFWPLMIIGSIIGIILYIVSKNYEENEYEKRARLGLALSVGSLLLYIAASIILLIVFLVA